MENERQFYPGQRVSVQRFKEDYFEPGWQVSGENDEEVTLVKRLKDGKYFEKTIPTDKIGDKIHVSISDLPTSSTREEVVNNNELQLPESGIIFSDSKEKLQSHNHPNNSQRNATNILNRLLLRLGRST